MKKYKEIAGIYLKAQLVWRADAMMNMVFTVTKILFAYLLWGVIFGENEQVSGFTFSAMLSYYIISSFLSQLDLSGGVSKEIATRIRNGTFSKYMIIPVNIEGYFFAMQVGVITFYSVFDLVAAVVWVFLFGFHFTLTTDPFLILGAVLMVVLGLVFMIQLNYYLGILTLKYQEISTFLMIKDNLVAFITGSIVPLTILPGGILSIMRIFPFYYITYLPSMLLIGRCSSEAIIGVLILLGWCFMMEILNRWTYARYRIKFDGVGI